MNKQKEINVRRRRRRLSTRKRVQGTAEKPRLCVFRSHKHMACQLIDDFNGKTLAAASTRDKELREQIKYGGNSDAAAIVGKAIAERALALGVSAVCLDRGHFKYHGRIAALADAARESGLKF